MNNLHSTLVVQMSGSTLANPGELEQNMFYFITKNKNITLAYWRVGYNLLALPLQHQKRSVAEVKERWWNCVT
jgi:hypothetical protein